MVAKHASPEAQLSLEANMLRHITDVADLPVPGVLHHADELLILEAMPGSHLRPAAEAHCAELIAALHGVTWPAHGFGRPTRNGRMTLDSPWSERWVPFFAERRLRFSMRLAARQGRLPEELQCRIEGVIDRIDELLEEPAQQSLLHGDLSNGNVLSVDDRVSAFLDPSACYGDPELELAYVTAFGAFGPASWGSTRRCAHCRNRSGVCADTPMPSFRC